MSGSSQMSYVNEEKNRNSQLWPIIKGLLVLFVIVLIGAGGIAVLISLAGPGVAAFFSSISTLDSAIVVTLITAMSKFNIATEYFRCIYHSVEKHIAGEKVYDGDGVSLGSCCADDAHAFVAKKLQLLNPNHFSL